jgi:hypothetical protein
MLTILFVVSLLILPTQLERIHAGDLNVTVATNKSVYNVGETVQVGGNLTYYGYQVSGGLVAIQINDRAVPFVIRTVYTGTLPSGPWRANITSVYMGDGQGSPLTNVKVGNVVYVWIYYQNNYVGNLDVTIAFTIYGANNVPLFAHIPLSQSVPPGIGYYVSYAWQVPSDADAGAAKIYASLFTAPPQSGGVPYCTEKSSAFNIVYTTSIAEEPMDVSGSYNLPVYIPKKNARVGNYTVYAGAFYNGFTATKSTIFQVILVGDINGDRFVNAKDGVVLGKAFSSKPGSVNWDSRADINGDGFVNAKDAIILGVNFGNSAL